MLEESRDLSFGGSCDFYRNSDYRISQVKNTPHLYGQPMSLTRSIMARNYISNGLYSFPKHRLGCLNPSHFAVNAALQEWIYLL
jgi:hypothetical protein